MSPTRQEIRAQRSAAAEARRQAKAKGTDRDAEPTETAAPAVPAPAGEANPSPSTAVPEAYRPQPFTPDLIPEPVDVEVDTEGDLTPQEVDDLEHCEAAYSNGNRAEWMKWKAAHAVRSRRLHREGGRTWPDYCQDRFGESESEVNRRIQQWPLLKAITEQQDRPRAIPDSHVHRLLPMAEQHGQEVTARAYVALRGWAAERRHRVTADVVDGLVELARAAEPPALTTSNTFQRAIEAKPKPKPTRSRKKEAAPADVETDAQEQSGAETGGHPNLGDSTGGAPASERFTDGDASVVDAEIVDDPAPHRAIETRDLLQGLRAGIEAGVLHDAPTEVLKDISTAALSIAYAADEILKDR
ncbi:hypothetical protein AB0H03_17570 [Streptomyces sparsogenes]|uniref:hypothetical protein n=1 Tax=Streptomyces sparsogenes TaxID=67365 RepID=UPI0033F0E41C